VVTRSDHRGPRLEQFDALLPADPATSGGILPVDDGEIDRQLFLQTPESLLQGFAPRLPDHVAQKKYPDHFAPPIQPWISLMSLMETSVPRAIAQDD